MSDRSDSREQRLLARMRDVETEGEVREYAMRVPDEVHNGDHLQPTARYWPDAKHGPWLLVFFWQVLDGRAECVGLDITSSNPSHVGQFLLGGAHPRLGVPLTTSLLRHLNLAELVAEERSRIARLFVAKAPGDIRWQGIFVPSEVDIRLIDSSQAPAPKMREATRRRLEAAATAYREAWRRGEPPTKAVAAALNVSPAAAAKLVLRARAAGMLPPTSAGVPAGE